MQGFSVKLTIEIRVLWFNLIFIITQKLLIDFDNADFLKFVTETGVFQTLTNLFKETACAFLKNRLKVF